MGKTKKRVKVADLELRLSGLEGVVKGLEAVLAPQIRQKRLADCREEAKTRLEERQRAYRGRLRKVRDDAHVLGNELAQYLEHADWGRRSPNDSKYVKLMRRALELLREQNELRRESFEIWRRQRGLR